MVWKREVVGWVISTKGFKNIKMFGGGVEYLESWYIWGGNPGCIYAYKGCTPVRFKII